MKRERERRGQEKESEKKNKYKYEYFNVMLSKKSGYNFHSILFSFAQFDGDLSNGFAYETLFSINSMGRF